MATRPVSTSSALFTSLGDFRWVRAHVSIFSVGAVLLVMVNLLIGGSRLWSLTAVGIWGMLLIVHLVLLAIARLSTELMADDEEEIVLLPVKDAVIVDPQSTPTQPDPTTGWQESESSKSVASEVHQPGETVSWQIATDVAQVKRQNPDSEPESS